MSMSFKTSIVGESRLASFIATAQKVLHRRFAQDVISHSHVQLIANDTVDSATTSVITAAAHSALPGHMIRFTSGTYAGYIVGVIDTDTNTITLAADLPAAPSASDAFQILAFRYPVLDSSGNLGVIIGSGNGYTPGKLISANTTNATVIKAAAGTLGYVTASNINADERFLKVYNKATTPTVGTDIPVHTFIIPGSVNGSGTNIPLPSQGIDLTAGISIAITALGTDADTTAVAANEIVVNYGYK